MSVQKTKNQFLPFLAMLLVMTMLLSLVLAKRPTIYGHFVLTEASLIFPITFYLADIITEIYGYRVVRKIIWFGFICQFIFCVICYFFVKFPAPPFWHQYNAYYIVLGGLLRIFGGSLVAAIMGLFFNVMVLSKWKILLMGRFFILRSLASSILGETVYSIVAGTIMFVNVYSLNDLESIVFLSISTKIIYSFVFIIPVSLIVHKLKKIEGDRHYDNNINLNPFKLELFSED